MYVCVGKRCLVSFLARFHNYIVKVCGQPTAASKKTHYTFSFGEKLKMSFCDIDGIANAHTHTHSVFVHFISILS